MKSRTVSFFGFLSLVMAAPGCLSAGSGEDQEQVGEAQQRASAVPTSLVQIVDYSDTFTETGARTNGLYDTNSGGAYDVQTGTPTAVWAPISNFSFNTPQSSTNPSLVGTATGNPGAATGVAQSGSGDFSFAYGLRPSYTVQADAIIPADRFDISSLPSAGATIFAGSSLSVFFRRDGGSLPGIGIYNGTTETDSGLTTGITDENWHNFAVNFDMNASRLRIFVDGAFKGALDLTTFGGGAYQNYPNAAVGVGGNGSVLWVDNVTVGSPRLTQSVLYSDTFTLTGARTDRLYDNNGAGAYDVEQAPATVAWAPISNFSFNSPQSSTNPSLLEAAAGDSGAATGLAQSGSGDFSIPLSNPSSVYVVQADAIIASDRFDISSLPSAGATIFTGSSLSVFFRRNGGTLPGIGIYNGSVETDTGCQTGITDQSWHNFAVRFDQGTKHAQMFVDGNLACSLDLASFAGGAYQSYSNAAVGMGGNGGVTWMDNFQAGPGFAGLPIVLHPNGPQANGLIGSFFTSNGVHVPPISTTRGVGSIPNACGAGYQLDADGLCYPDCESGYTGVGPVCWQTCASGWTDFGVTCVWNDGAPTSLSCGTTSSFPFISCSCPSNFTNTGVACAANPETKSTYGRGVGSAASCGSGLQQDADGLCYPWCPAGYTGVGPVCWISGSTQFCAAIYDGQLASGAQTNELTMTYGVGAAFSAGVTASVEGGVAYGPNGEYGCYQTTCTDFSTSLLSASLGAWSDFGQFTVGFEGIAGTTSFVDQGASASLVGPVAAGATLGFVLDASGQSIGTVEAMGLGAGRSPITLGGQCTTTLTRLW